MQETINYPAGSDQVYAIPLPNTVTPGPTDIVFTLFDGQQFAVPSNRMVLMWPLTLTRRGETSVRESVWVAASKLLEQSTSEDYQFGIGYVEVVASPGDQVNAVAASGATAEATAVQYSVARGALKLIANVASSDSWTSMVNPATVNTQQVGAYSGCSCVLTQDPCGDRLAVVLFAPGTYVP